MVEPVETHFLGRPPHNGAELWRRLRAIAGFRGSLRVVAEWATRRRRAESAGCETEKTAARPDAEPFAAERARSFDEGRRDHRGAHLEEVPLLVSARELVERFHRMVRDRDPTALPVRIIDAAGSVLASFGKGIVADRGAVAAAMTQPWSNDQTEGQITKLKLVKRQMYGRAKLDLLRARLLASA